MAPKMTKCGHIYCWTCILRYLSMTDKGWRKCPICFDSISEKHLKSATIELTSDYQENDKINFTLMCRKKDCMLALPASHWRPLDNLLAYDDVDSVFARLVRIDDPTLILDKEQAELLEASALAQASGDETQLLFITRALSQIEERRAAIKHMAEEIGSSASEANGSGAKEDHPPQCKTVQNGEAQKSAQMQAARKQMEKKAKMKISSRKHSVWDDSESDDPDSYDDHTEDDHTETETETETETDEEHAQEHHFPAQEADHPTTSEKPPHPIETESQATRPSSSQPSSHEPAQPRGHGGKGGKLEKEKKGGHAGQGGQGLGDNVYYFYQSSEGQHVYLHPVDFRCLTTEYGSYANLPHHLEGQIVDLEDITQSEMMRRRRKSIVGHLPLSTEFRFCEIDIRSLVSPATFAAHRNDLAYRFEKHRKRKQEQAKAKAQAQAQAAANSKAQAKPTTTADDHTPTTNGHPISESTSSSTSASASTPLSTSPSSTSVSLSALPVTAADVNVEVAQPAQPTNVWTARAQKQATQGKSQPQPQPQSKVAKGKAKGKPNGGGPPSFLQVLSNTAPPPVNTIRAFQSPAAPPLASSPSSSSSSSSGSSASAWSSSVLFPASGLSTSPTRGSVASGTASSPAPNTAHIDKTPTRGKKQRQAKQIVLFSTVSGTHY